MELLPVLRTHEIGFLPTRAYDTDAGLDLYTPESFTIERGKGMKVNIQVAIALPKGYHGIIAGRSGNNSKGIHIFPGVIDTNYRGPLWVILAGLSNEKPVYFMRGDKIAQLLIYKTEYFKPHEVIIPPEEFAKTDRGINGLGSTGR